MVAAEVDVDDEGIAAVVETAVDRAAVVVRIGSDVEPAGVDTGAEMLLRARQACFLALLAQDCLQVVATAVTGVA